MEPWSLGSASRGLARSPGSELSLWETVGMVASCEQDRPPVAWL